MTEPRRNRSRWIFWVLAIVVLGSVVYLLTLSLASPLDVYTLTGRNLRYAAMGLDAFKCDWGQYPPSSNRTGGAREFGYQCLAVYLLGPAGNGWGKPVNQPLPFDSPSERLWGPYYEHYRGERMGPPEAIFDGLEPAKPLLYFRFERDRDPPYDVRDNPVDPTGATGFASQEHFELFVRRKDASGTRKWVREDYLLIFPGYDRLYGHVIKDKATGKMRPARPEEVNTGMAVCDDTVNF